VPLGVQIEIRILLKAITAMRLSVLFVILVLFVAPNAKADCVLVGNTFVNSALAVSSNEFLAQPFVMTGIVSVSEIKVTFVSNDPNSLFQFDVTDTLGVSANVLAHQDCQGGHAGIESRLSVQTEILG